MVKVDLQEEKAEEEWRVEMEDLMEGAAEKVDVPEAAWMEEKQEVVKVAEEAMEEEVILVGSECTTELQVDWKVGVEEEEEGNCL